MGNWVDRLSRIICERDVDEVRANVDEDLRAEGWKLDGSDADGAYARRFELRLGAVGACAVVEIDAEEPHAPIVERCAKRLSQRLACRTAVLREGRFDTSYEELANGLTTMAWDEAGQAFHLMQSGRLPRPSEQRWLDAFEAQHRGRHGVALMPDFVESLVEARFGLRVHLRVEGGEVARRWADERKRYRHRVAQIGEGPERNASDAYFDDLYARMAREPFDVRGFARFRRRADADGTVELLVGLGRELSAALKDGAPQTLAPGFVRDAACALLRGNADVALGRHMLLTRRVQEGGLSVNPATGGAIEPQARTVFEIVVRPLPRRDEG